MARPTKSRNLFVQQAGRGTRLSEGKTDCILLDHAGNIDYHGFPTDEYALDLDGEPEREKSEKKSKTCKVCFAVYRGPKCPECGVEAPPAPAVEIEETDHELKEINAREPADPLKKMHKELLKDAKKSGRSAASAHYKFLNRVGLDAAKPYLPQWLVEKEERGLKNLFANSPFRGVSANGILKKPNE